jgi:cell division protein FtsI (penicillin-binding protein 3)
MTPGIPRAARLRAYLTGVVVTAGLSGVAWRAWALQVGDGDRYRAIAAKQHALTVALPAPRGQIIDARGRQLAISADTDSIWADPREIRDVTDTAERIAKLLGGDAMGLEAKLAGDRRFVWLGRHVSPELARAVRQARLPGITVGKEPRRWYPARTIAGPVVGRSDIDGRGLDGIELAMNAQLVGRRGEGVAVRDARGKKMFADGLDRPEPGATVQLSVDTSVQASAEAALAEGIEVNRARSGVVVAIEVTTGRVLAMASWPTYDPNGGGPAGVPEAGRDGGARNRAVTDVYEAGSVMKIFSVAAALDDGTVTPDTGFDVGALRIGAKSIRDVHDDPYLTVAGIIKRSSNIGAAKIALRFGAVKLHAALRRFGFGARSGIELPGEQAGVLRDGARWRDIELATISYGYGLAVTPLQIGAALAAFGNGGVYIEPRIVDRVVDADGTVLYRPSPASRQIVSERTAAQMRAMLASTFEGGRQAGTAATVVVPGFRCGGKSGTARKLDPLTKQYTIGRYVSTFAGLAPIDEPRLAIVVLIDEPSERDYYGGKVAGPVFARVASEALRYLGVPGTASVCDPAAPPSTDAKTCHPAPRPSTPSQPMPAQARAQPAAPSAPAAAAFPVFAPLLDAAAEAAPARVSIPDFRGMGVARALSAARAAGITVEIAGTGRVVEQHPAPGSAGPGSRVSLRFADGNAP